jgi:phosphocarrier protein
MKEMKVKVKNQSGLHARPAALLVKEASKYSSEVTGIKEGKAANLKSIIGVLGLGVYKDDEIIIRAEGKDEDEALKAVIKVIENFNN